MENYRNYYRADKGKQFVVTEKVKKEWVQCQHKKIGEAINPKSFYFDDVPKWAVERGYLEEKDIKDWVRTIGIENGLKKQSFVSNLSEKVSKAKKLVTNNENQKNIENILR